MIKNKTLMIVGYGYNGADLARKAKFGFDMKTIGVRKDAKNEYGKEYLDNLIPIEKFEEHLHNVDFLVSYLPQTNETTNYFNLHKFSLMKESSVFINLGRGTSVIEEDLIKVLKERRILGASLDVTWQEPLSRTSPLYDLENVYLSCHSADNTDEVFNQAVDVFVKNLEMYFDQGKFYSPVDKQKGY